MRTVILLGSIIVSGAIMGLPGWYSPDPVGEIKGFLAVVIMVCISMDIVDFIRGK
jgi:hypothetical protein